MSSKTIIDVENDIPLPTTIFVNVVTDKPFIGACKKGLNVVVLVIEKGMTKIRSYIDGKKYVGDNVYDWYPNTNMSGQFEYIYSDDKSFYITQNNVIGVIHIEPFNTYLKLIRDNTKEMGIDLVQTVDWDYVDDNNLKTKTISDDDDIGYDKLVIKNLTKSLREK